MHHPALRLLATLVVAMTIHGGCSAKKNAAVSSRALPTVTLLAEGYVTPIEGRNFVPGQRDDGARRVASSIVLVRAVDATIIVDPGMIADRSTLLTGLREAGVTPAEVTHVFLSHHHPDHTVNTAIFPNARVVDFWGIYAGDLWEDHGDNFEIASGVSVLRTPGHTAEDATLLIETPDGTYACTHLWWNAQMEPAIDPLADDQAAIERHRDIVLRLADWIIPGHGGMFRSPRRS